MRRTSSRRAPKRAEKFEYIEDLPSRNAIADAFGAIGRPCALDVLARELGVRGRVAREALERRVKAMVRDGQLLRTRDDCFGLSDRMELIAGRIIAHRDGYAFVNPDEGEQDIYLAPREARCTLHGDRVLVRIAGQDRRGRPYGHLVEVIERAHARVVGRYFRDRSVGFVVPDNRHFNQDVLIPDGAEGGAGEGQIVVAEIEQQPDRHTQPIGRVTEILGAHMAAGMETEIALRSHNLPSDWPDAALAEASALPKAPGAADIARRRDLRDLPLVTIDGADARDFDDAVHARRTAGGFMLTVAIADVAHYVQPDSALDDEARTRGTSVYFPDRVIPMLPEALSNGLCSLVPDADRLALVCEININGDGEIRRTRFFEAVIRSHARLIYEEVQAWHDDPPPHHPFSKAVADSLCVLYDLHDVLRQAREARGALDIDSVEPRFHYGAGGKIERVEGVTRVDAHRLIEECMIAANVATARHLERRKVPGLFRVHHPPAEDKVEDLSTFLREIGMNAALGEVDDPAAFAAILRWARDRADRRLIESVLMRSLKLAVYSAENAGHFGLALAAYAHFTSPIRRYPDLVVHRALKASIGAAEPVEEALGELAEHCSMCERRAEDASRDVVAWLKCEFMLDKLGEQFDGLVSGVAEFGVFVQLDDIFVEGLVHVTALPGDYYHYDAIHHELRGRSSGRSFRPGQALTVTVARVDLDERRIDFSLEGGAQRRRRKRR